MKVRVRRDGEPDRSLTVGAPEAFLGKHPDCAVVLADATVSRRHARAFLDAGRLFVEDLGSTNGTRIGERRLEGPLALTGGEEITIGPFIVTIEVDEVSPTAAQPPAAEATLQGTVSRPSDPARGPLGPLLEDDTVSEIMVNGPSEIFVERRGRIELTEVRFPSADALRDVITAMAAEVGRTIDDRRSMLDARMRDGSRMNAILAPLAVRGPYLTIRRFSRAHLSMEQLVRARMLGGEMSGFLRAAVTGRLNLLISGGTGSGKTTLLNALCASMGERERIVTIEDAAELRLPQRHVLPLETRPPDLSGIGEVTIRDLLRNALRMRPDRIVIGEVRGGEALDMLQAMNSGHEGSVGTLHANSPREALSRLETLVLFAGLELPVRAIREQIVGALRLIVHVGRMPDGSRRVISVTELSGLEGDQFTTGEIFRYDLGQDRFIPTGYVPRCRDLLVARGHAVDNAWFR